MTAIFFRALEADDKATVLLNAIQSPDKRASNRFEVDPSNFADVPKSPFAYWASAQLRTAFRRLPAMEAEGRTAKQGLATADDFRFVRSSWEVPPNAVGQIWFSFAKGGAFSPYYADIHLLVNWKQEGSEVKNNLNSRGQVRSNVWMLRDTAANCFFRPGLTWPLRTQKGLALRVMPSCCIFSHKGPVVFVEGDDPTALLALLAVANSLIFSTLVELQMAFGSYEVGVIQRTPTPNLSYNIKTTLSALAHRTWSLKRNLDIHVETSHACYLPALLQIEGECLTERALAWIQQATDVKAELTALQSKINDLCFTLYGVNDKERHRIEQGFDAERRTEADNIEVDDEENESEDAAANVAGLVSGLISWSFGAVLGRWDLGLITGERQVPDVPDPFDPLPVCSPGMLQNAQGLPATPADVPADYPLRIFWPGILVDDEDHPEDIVRRVRAVLQVIWPANHDAIEGEACEILGVRTLRDYFRKPAAFFADHLKRYSKSRRQAPIYWPLSTSSGSYTLWLYYHRLTGQTLYTCVNDFVDPKLKTVTEAASVLRQKSNRTRTEEKELEQLGDLALELQDFRAELLRIATFWQPNLNDGVQITAAPLWRLFQHRPWQKRLKETWDKLAAGDYDWAHLAYTIWPDRVAAKCQTDKSLAIAHNLEHLYVEPPATAKRQRRRKKTDVEAEQADEQQELFDETEELD